MSHQTPAAREDLLACLRAVATLLNGLSGEAIRGLMAESLRNPDLMEVIRMRFIDPNVSHFLDVLRRGAARGEVRATALTPASPALAQTCSASISWRTASRSPTRY